ncbi:MAG: hypothetical protein ACLFPF_07175 [Halanaerobiales bacterium]
MFKKAKIKRCIDCPVCVDVGLGATADYKCNYGNKVKDIDNAFIIQDWCPLEDWEE